MGALGRRKMIVDKAESELERVDLRGAELTKLDLPDGCFAYANLDGANFAEANLADATLSETTLRNTDLSGANLREADLTGALLDGAILRGADQSKTEGTPKLPGRSLIAPRNGPTDSSHLNPVSEAGHSYPARLTRAIGPGHGQQRLPAQSQDLLVHLATERGHTVTVGG